MNNCFPDWNIEGDFSVANQKKAIGSDNELIELLWRNGQVVLHSQAHRKTLPSYSDQSQIQKHDLPTPRAGGSCENLSSLIQDDETVSWIQDQFDDSFDKEFCSNFFNELVQPNPVETNKPIKKFKEEKTVKFGASDGTNIVANLSQTVAKNSGPEQHAHPMPPPRFQCPDISQKNPNSGGLGTSVNFSSFSPSAKANLGSPRGQFGGKRSGTIAQGEVRECSVMTVGSSHCGSNQMLNETDLSRASSSGVGTSGLSAGLVKDKVRRLIQQSDQRGQTETLEPTVTSSSSASGSSLGKTCKQSSGSESRKRKGRDAEEAECQSEAAELESAAGNKQAQRSVSTRRSRAAEVHNLSERRRRDRINEKMRALQELIPHCNKSDKASMLDEAIEYLKSLQLQLQLLWMRSGMTPMIFPGVQQYMSQMGVGMGPPPFPSIHNPMHLPRVPFVDQSIPVVPTPNHTAMCQNPVLNPMNYQNQMQNPNFQEQYARYMGFHHMQTAAQPSNMFNFASQAMPQTQTMALPGSSSGPSIGRAGTDDAQSDKLG